MLILLHNETNFIYTSASSVRRFGARYYDSDLSSWLSVDPLASKRSWVSPYNYCQNNPIARVDPTGALDIKNLDWFQNVKTGEIVYHKDLGRNDANMLGKDYSWFGKDNVFGDSPVDVYNSVMGTDVAEVTNFSFTDITSKRFMLSKGYSFVPRTSYEALRHSVQVASVTPGGQSVYVESITGERIVTERNYIRHGLQQKEKITNLGSEQGFGNSYTMYSMTRYYYEKGNLHDGVFKIVGISLNSWNGSASETTEGITTVYDWKYITNKTLLKYKF